MSASRVVVAACLYFNAIVVAWAVIALLMLAVTGGLGPDPDERTSRPLAEVAPVVLPIGTLLVGGSLLGARRLRTGKQLPFPVATAVALCGLPAALLLITILLGGVELRLGTVASLAMAVAIILVGCALAVHLRWGGRSGSTPRIP